MRVFREMMSLPTLMASSIAIGSSLCAACRTSVWPFDENSRLGGVPLSSYTATDGRYFPGFIRQNFPGARRFEQEFGVLGEARSGMKLIEIKQLSADKADSNEANLSWSIDGAFLGFEVAAGSERKILVKDLAGQFSRELKVLPNARHNFLDGLVTSSAHSYNASLRWSRDSTRFAFMSNGGTGDYGIYVGAVGAHDRAIAKSHAKDGYASWSPKTNEMAFVSSRSGNGDVYLVDVATQGLKKLSRSDDVDLFPEWRPDGNGIVFCSGDALNHDIVLVERLAAGEKWSAPIRMTEGVGDELRPIVSPDGRLVAFYGTDRALTEGGNPLWNIHVLPTGSVGVSGDDLAATVVARDVVIDLNTGPAWTPDSRKLIFVKRDPTAFNPIYGYDLYAGRAYLFQTDTRLNRDIIMSPLGVLSFRAQVGAWDKVFIALTNQGIQLQSVPPPDAKVNYLAKGKSEKDWL